MTTLDDRVSLVPAQNVEPGTPAPYKRGQIVEVLVGRWDHNLDVQYAWMTAAVVDCFQPRGARRFVCTVALGQSIHSAYMTSRVYCNADGEGEEIRPRQSCGAPLVHSKTGSLLFVCDRDPGHEDNRVGPNYHKQIKGPCWPV